MSAALLAATSSCSRRAALSGLVPLLSRSNSSQHQQLLLFCARRRRPLTSACAKPTRMQQPLSVAAAAAAAENVNPASAKPQDTNEMASGAPPAKRAAVGVPVAAAPAHAAAAAADEPLRVRRLVEAAVLPVRGSALAAGYDLSSAEDTEVPARGKALVSTGLVVAVPAGTYGRVAPRSGLAWKHFVDVGAGVVDADYRGELKVVLYNHSEVAFKVSKGDRVAQLVLERIATPEVVEDADLGDTARGAGGFGSTGVAGALPPAP